MAPDNARPRPPAKGEEKELAWPNAGVEVDTAPRPEGCPNVGFEVANPVPGGDGRVVAPRMEGWPKVGWLGVRVEDMEGADGRDEVPRMEGFEPKADVVVC